MRLPQRSSLVRVGSAAPVLEIWNNGKAGAILFYPGTMLAPGHYSVLVTALLEAGLTVAGLHLSGHGECRRIRDFTFADLLAEGLAAETWLRRNGFAPVAVCGHSQGGILALAHAGMSVSLRAAFSISAVFPEMASAICLTRFSPLVAWRRQILSLIENIAKFVPRLPVPLPVYLKISQIIAAKRTPAFLGGAKGRCCYPLKFLTSLFNAHVGRRVNCPYWLFNARDDALFTASLIHEVFAMIDAESKTLVWLSGGGHMAPLNPGLAQFIARNIAAACAGLGMPLNLSPMPRRD